MYMRIRQNVCIRWGGGESQKSIQAVKVQVLCSRRRVAFESSTTPVGTAWLCGGNCQVFELNSNQLGDLCCKCDSLGMKCLCSCPLLLTGAPSIFVPESYQFGLCRSVGIYCMGSDKFLLICSPLAWGS